jgi:endogenous inhibitor of DNA gyrase (YacG/DUF329 family)
MEKRCEGKCPTCGSNYVLWHDSEIQDGFMVYEAECDECGKEFQEEYKLVYEVTTYEK